MRMRRVANKVWPMKGKGRSPQSTGDGEEPCQGRKYQPGVIRVAIRPGKWAQVFTQLQFIFTTYLIFQYENRNRGSVRTLNY